MSAPKPKAKPEPSEQERLLGELIAVLAEACNEADERGLFAPRPSVTARRLSAARRMSTLAVTLARCVAAGDAAAADRLLAVQRPASDWRQLALLLASAADVERLAAPAERRAA